MAVCSSVALDNYWYTMHECHFSTWPEAVQISIGSVEFVIMGGLMHTSLLPQL